MKEAILKVLLENTDTEELYVGGGLGPIIIKLPITFCGLAKAA
jgi:hypothetical protein